MNLSGFAQLGIVEAEVSRHDTILERKKSEAGVGRIRKGVYPRSQFSYSNYNVDPRPDVLKLGYWVHPSTGNTLLGGINLNYLSAGQVKKLKEIAKQLFARGTLRSRYRYLRRKLPDIAQYYRTYDEDYIYSDQPDEFKDFDFRDVKEPDLQDLQAKKDADAEKVADMSQEVEPEVDSADVVDKDREAWAAKRRLYDPDTGKRTKPEREKLPSTLDAKREKLNRYRSQRRKMKELQRDAAMKRLAAAIKRDAETTTDAYAEPALEVPRQSDLGPYECKDYSYLPELGFNWNSSAAYRRYHSLDRFNVISELCPGSKLAVLDTRTGHTLVDAVSDHVFILENAGWDYSHTILIEKVGDELVFSSVLGNADVVGFLTELNYSGIAQVLSE